MRRDAVRRDALRRDALSRDALRRGAGPAALAIALAATAAGCGARTPAAPTRTAPPKRAPARTAHGLTVSPASARPTSTIRLSFRAPVASGRQGRTQFVYALGVRGPKGRGCVAARSFGIPVGRAGETVAVRLGPAQLGGPWCPGRYTAKVQELARPVCRKGQMCPQFIRVVADIGPVTFRITR